MKHSIYFEEKELLVTDEETPSEINVIVYREKNDIVQAIKHLEFLSKVILYGEWERIFADLKTLYKYIEAAGGFIKNEQDEYLFIFRRGKWDLPKGKLEKGETPEIAAIREVQEETGLQFVKEKSLRCTTWHTYDTYGEPVLKQTYWFNMETTKNQDSKPQTEEDITELQWLPESEFSKVLGNTFPSIVEVMNKR
ncbi:MAG: NUDIX domain-containing protein [Bacteroidales bacterium]|nr:NUDIX domain-containing protein [Bacteroidales bacterium]